VVADLEVSPTAGAVAVAVEDDAAGVACVGAEGEAGVVVDVRGEVPVWVPVPVLC
jgi:hypothetical protein